VVVNDAIKNIIQNSTVPLDRWISQPNFIDDHDQIIYICSTNSSKLPLIDEEQTNQAEEKKDSLAIFFILLVIVLAIIMVHLLIKYQIRFMPESLAIVLLGMSQRPTL
jgi:hypothetical protein